MEILITAVIIAGGIWFSRKVLAGNRRARESVPPPENEMPLTRYYSREEFQELTEPGRETRHRLRATINKKRWRLRPDTMGMPRLDELDAVVKEAGEIRTEFAVFWNHERAENDELHDLVTREYDAFVGLQIDAEDTRFEWLDKIADWLEETGALSLADINNRDPDQWTKAVRKALADHVDGKPRQNRKTASVERYAPPVTAYRAG